MVNGEASWIVFRSQTFSITFCCLFPASLASSLQLLSQAQAKSALALKRIVKLSSSDLLKVMPPASSGNSGGSSTTTSNPPLSRKERLRAAVRGALGSHHPHEEDISDSIFLGKADATTISAANKTPHPLATTSSRANDQTAYEQHNEGGTLVSASQDSPHDSNPVDEMYVSSIHDEFRVFSKTSLSCNFPPI